MATDDTYKLVLTAFGQGSFYQLTHFLNQTSETVLTQSMCATVATDFKECWRPYQVSAISYQNWKMTQVRGAGITPIASECRTEGGLFFQGTFTTSQAGGDAIGDPLPPQCALVVTWTTGLIGRRRRGRTYIFGQSEQQQVAGIWNAGQLTQYGTNLATLYAKYGQGGTSADWDLGVWSSRTATGCVINPSNHQLVNVDPPNLADAFRTVTGYTLRNVVYTQRRRGIGRGR